MHGCMRACGVARSRVDLPARPLCCMQACLSAYSIDFSPPLLHALVHGLDGLILLGLVRAWRGGAGWGGALTLSVVRSHFL